MTVIVQFNTRYLLETEIRKGDTEFFTLCLEMYLFKQKSD